MECLGVSGAGADVEVIDLSAEIFRRLGLRNLEVVLNSVGCPVCRPIVFCSAEILFCAD